MNFLLLVFSFLEGLSRYQVDIFINAYVNIRPPFVQRLSGRYKQFKPKQILQMLSKYFISILILVVVAYLDERSLQTHLGDTFF